MMIDEYEKMMAWQLCQKLATGEWKWAICKLDSNSSFIKYRLDTESNNLQYENTPTHWNNSELDVNDLIYVKKFIPHIVYNLTFKEACEIKLNNRQKTLLRNHYDEYVGDSYEVKLKMLNPYTVEVNLDDINSKWRCEDY